MEAASVPDAGTGEEPTNCGEDLSTQTVPETGLEATTAAAPAVSSTASPAPVSVVQRHQFDVVSLDKALELAAKCEAVERQGPGNWLDSTWEQCVKLRPILFFVAQPAFSLPTRFQKAMDTCTACLLTAPEGHLHCAKEVTELLESADLSPLLQYLEWFEPALCTLMCGVREASPTCSSSCRTVLVPQRVRSALSSWSAECELLRQSATALWEALLTQAPFHLRSMAERRQCEEARQAMQEAQVEEAARILRTLEATTSEFEDELQDERNQGLPKLVQTSQAVLRNIEQLASKLLESRKESLPTALDEYKALGERAAASSAIVCEARRQVRRHEKALGQTLQRFIELASQLVAWTSVLVPKLRLLQKHQGDLRAAVNLQSRLPVLEREKIEAEDEYDAAVTELRKHRRHASASRVRPSPQNPPKASMETSTSRVIEMQSEMREKLAEERVSQLTAQLKEAECLFEEAVAKLPLTIVREDTDDHFGARSSKERSPEERLALKLAELQETHEVMALQVSEEQAQHARVMANVLAEVETRRADEALRRRVEPDLMCPIMHERMNEPVIAADGHTYERQAIERWMQMHNTSPMTGAALAHRYLTQNLSLRHLIASYEAQLPKDNAAENRLDDDDDDDEEEEEHVASDLLDEGSRDGDDEADADNGGTT